MQVYYTYNTIFILKIYCVFFDTKGIRAFLVYCKIVKLDKVCNFVKLDLSEEYVLIVIKITIFP